MPDPGLQNSIPNLRAALSRKSNTSWFVTMERYVQVMSAAHGDRNTWFTRLQVCICAFDRLNKVIAVYTRWDCTAIHSCTYELESCTKMNITTAPSRSANSQSHSIRGSGTMQYMPKHEDSLCGCILHRYTLWTELQVRFTAHNVATGKRLHWIVYMTIQNLLRQSERPVP